MRTKIELTGVTIGAPNRCHVGSCCNTACTAIRKDGLNEHYFVCATCLKDNLEDNSWYIPALPIERAAREFIDTQNRLLDASEDGSLTSAQHAELSRSYGRMRNILGL